MNLLGQFRSRKRRSSEERLNLLAQLSRELTIDLDIVNVMRRTLALSLRAVDASLGSFVLIDDQGRPAIALYLREGKFKQADMELTRKALHEGLAGYVLENREPALVPDVEANSRWTAIDQDTWNDPVRTAICVPLLGRQRVVGILACTHPEANHFTQDDLASFELVASQAAVAVETAYLFAAEEQRRHLADTLGEIARTLTATLELDTVLALILEQLGQMVLYSRACIFLLEGQKLNIRACHGEPELDKETHSTSLDLADNQIMAQVIASNRPLIYQDVQQEEWRSQTPVLPTTRSWAVTPLVARGEVVGVLMLESQEAGLYTDADVRTITAFADNAAIAIANARLVLQLQRRLDEVGFLHRTGRTLTASLELDEVLGGLLESLRNHFQVEVASVVLVEEETDELVVEIATGSAAKAVVGSRLKPGQGITGWVASTGQPALVSSAQDDPRHEIVTGLEDFQATSMLAAPIQLGGKTIGVIEAVNPPSQFLTEDNLDLLMNTAALAASAIQNARHFTRARDAEQRYSSLFNNSADPIIITDAQGIITDVNLKLCAILGYEKDELLGTGISTLHRDPHVTQDQLSEVARGESVAYNVDALASNGTSKPFEVRANTVFHNSRRYVQWVCHDMTEQLHLEQIRRDLTHMIIHDLRNPLGSLMSSLGLIRAAVVDQSINIPLDQLFTVGQRSGDKLRLLIDSILDMARLEEEPELDREQVNIKAMVSEVVEQVRPTATTADIELGIHIADNLPPVWGDRDLLQRVLQNLLDNALKYTPPHGQITVNVAMAGDNAALFAVADTGRGIPAKYHDRIFDRFFRDGTGVGKGTGLGLALCKLAVEAHGGRIWVESKIGQGTTFKFTIPYSQERLLQ